jgi:hypothetical protein
MQNNQLDYQLFASIVDRYKEIGEDFMLADAAINNALDGIIVREIVSPSLYLIDSALLDFFSLFYNFDNDYLEFTDREIEEIFLAYVHKDTMSFPEFENKHRQHIIEEHKFLQSLRKDTLPPFITDGKVIKFKGKK